MSRRFRTASLAVLALAVAVPPATTTAAPADDAAWLTASTDPLVHLDDLVPGSIAASTFEVRNPRAQAVRFSLRAVDLVTDDNGCNRPEGRAGDRSCGAGGGELQHDLVVRLLAVGDLGATRVVDEGSLTEVEDRWLADASPLDPGATRTYVLEHELLGSTTDLTQTDRVGFDIEAALATTGPQPRGAGASIDRRDVTRLDGARLAAHRGPHPVPLLAALFILALGLALGVARRLWPKPHPA